VTGAGDKEDRCSAMGICARLCDELEGGGPAAPVRRAGAAFIGVRPGSADFFSFVWFLRVELSLFEAGDLALLADSMIQCLMEASWLRKGCWCLRCRRVLITPFDGDKRSGFVATNCSVLPRDRLNSLGGGGGRCRVELIDRERNESFSIGVGGMGDPGVSTVIPSGNRGSSGKMSVAGESLVAVTWM